MAEIHVLGLADLQKVLDQVAPKIERNILRGALRNSMNEVKPAAQQGVHSISGLLAAGLKVGTRAKGGTVYATLKATGKHAYIAPWLEYGTKAHMIPKRSAIGTVLVFSGLIVRSVNHPGIAPHGDKSVIGPHAFLRPALDQQANAAVVAAAEYMKERLATKQGLDTSHITIEGDE